MSTCNQLHGVSGPFRALCGEVKSWASYSLAHTPSIRSARPGSCLLIASSKSGAGMVSKLPPSQSPHLVPPSLSCNSTSRCVYVLRYRHLPFPQAFAGPQNKEEEQEGFGVTHSGSADHRGPGLFVLVNWPAMSCLVWDYRIRIVFIFEFGAVRAEKKDLGLRMPRAWPLSSHVSLLLLLLLLASLTPQQV